jgi:hypothetical protein
MSENIIKGIDNTLENFKPRELYEVTKVDNYKHEKITHKLTGY